MLLLRLTQLAFFELYCFPFLHIAFKYVCTKNGEEGHRVNYSLKRNLSINFCNLTDTRK